MAANTRRAQQLRKQKAAAKPKVVITKTRTRIPDADFAHKPPTRANFKKP